MIEAENKTGKYQLDEKIFLRFKSREQQYTSFFPLRLLLWDTPCQREFFLDSYSYTLKCSGQKGKAWHFRLFIPEAFLRLDLEWELTPSGFFLRFFPETLIEERPNLVKVMAMDILPDFFQAEYGESGYFLLPAYCGAVCYFDRRRLGESRAMVYSEQPRWEDFGTMPVCGVKKTQGAWLCILSGGQFDARIVTRTFYQGKKLVYTCCPSFIFRHQHSDFLSSEVREARYFYLSGEQADYNQMAHIYREYLMKVRGLQPLRARIAGNPALDYATRSYHCKIFQGMKFSRYYDGEEEMTVLTTFEEAREIARDLKKAGVKRCVLFLVGWNPEGHDGMYPSRFPIEARLGGETGWKKLKEELDKLDYRLSVHDNHVDCQRRSPYFPHLDLLTDRQLKPVGGSHWGGGATYRICPATMPSPKSLLDLERMRKLGVNGIYYLDAMPSPLFSCHHPEHPATRKGYAEGLRRLAQSVRDIFGAVVTEGYNDYIVEALDAAWVLPPPIPGLVRFHLPEFVDELVPFMQVSLHGLILYHSAYSYGFTRAGYSVSQAVAVNLGVGGLPVNEMVYRQDRYWKFPQHTECLKAMAEEFAVLCERYGHWQMKFLDFIQHDTREKVFFSRYEDGTELTADYGSGKIAVREKGKTK